MSGSKQPRALDHVALFARDLDKAERTFARLGFRLTERGFHSGATKPGQPIEPWGQANHCAPFRHGYLEVLGVFDETRFAPAKSLLERYEGVHLLAFATKDADATAQEFAARFKGKVTPQSLERPVRLDDRGDEIMLARFANVHPPAGTFPEGRVFAIEHLTPEAIWQPRLMDHPNGVLALCGVDMIVADPCDSAGRFADMMNASFRKEGESLVVGDDALGEIRLHPPGASPAWLGTIPIAAPPWIAGIRFAVNSTAATGAFLDGVGVAAKPDGSAAIVVPSREAHGTALRFHSLSS